MTKITTSTFADVCKSLPETVSNTVKGFPAWRHPKTSTEILCEKGMFEKKERLDTGFSGIKAAVAFHQTFSSGAKGPRFGFHQHAKFVDFSRTNRLSI